MPNRLIIVVCMALLVSACGDIPIQSADVAEPEPTVIADERVIADASVIPVQHAILSMPAGGIVAEVLVEVGQEVALDEPLVRLDSTSHTATVVEAEASLAEAQAAYERLRAGATPAEIAAAEAAVAEASGRLRQTQGRVTNSDIVAANAEVEEAAERLRLLEAGPKETDIRDVTAQLSEAEANLTTQRDSLSAAKSDAKGAMDQAVAELTQAQATFATAQNNWDHVEEHGKDPFTSASLNEAQERQYYDTFIQAQASLAAAETSVHQAQIAYDTARQNEIAGIQAAEGMVTQQQAQLDNLLAPEDADVIAQARAQLATAQANREKLQGAQRAGEINSAQGVVAQSQAQLEQLLEGTHPDDLAVAQAQVQSATAALEQARVALDQTELRAPFAGVVAAVHIVPHEFVEAGFEVAHLADESAWQIETTDLTELQVTQFAAGADAIVTFDALPGLEMPATVSQIEGLGEDQAGDIVYRAILVPENHNDHLRWNMTATVSISS